MKLSVIVPIGDFSLYAPCRASLQAAIAPVRDEVELVEVDDSAHRGVDWARNEGLRRAKGEYVAWVDSDDEVTADWAAEIFRALESDPDLIHYSIISEWVDQSERDRFIVPCLTEGVIDPLRLAQEVIGGYRCVWLWSCVFRRTLFADVVFRGKYYEDYRVMREVLPKVRKAVGIRKAIYRYKRREGSLSHYGDCAAAQEAVQSIIFWTDQLHDEWVYLMRKATAQMCADLCWNGVGAYWCRSYMLRNITRIIFDFAISWRTKAKYLLALFCIRPLGRM